MCLIMILGHILYYNKTCIKYLGLLRLSNTDSSFKNCICTLDVFHYETWDMIRVNHACNYCPSLKHIDSDRSLLQTSYQFLYFILLRNVFCTSQATERAHIYSVFHVGVISYINIFNIFVQI